MSRILESRWKFCAFAVGLILEASKDKSGPPSVRQTFNFKCWSAAVTYLEPSQGGARSLGWGGGLVISQVYLISQKAEFVEVGTQLLYLLAGAFDPSVSRTFERFIAFG